MKRDQFGQMIFDQDDIVDLVMQDKDLAAIQKHMLVDATVDLEVAAAILNHVPQFVRYDDFAGSHTMQEFDHNNQTNWFMPDHYKNMDIAAHVLSLCNTEPELQRCGQELLLYQERGLFDLLKFLTYLVDLMKQNNLIWGVGRGSSVSSYVLYKLGVHRIDSLYYDLDITEFLR